MIKMRSAVHDEHSEALSQQKTHFRAQHEASADLEDYRVLTTMNFDLNVLTRIRPRPFTLTTRSLRKVKITKQSRLRRSVRPRM